MNTFANSLFSLLFGWARGMIQQVWSTASSGRYSGFFVWLGDHWLWVAAALCLICTAVDFLVWMVRWRPYLVWRTLARKATRWFRGEEKVKDAWRFSRGYQGGIALDIPQDAPEQRPEAWQEPVWPAEDEAPERTPAVYPAQETPAEPEMEWNPESRQRYFIPPQVYEAPPMELNSRANSAYGTDLPAARRHRRSEKYERRRAVWRDKLIRGDADDDALLDGLPPAVDKQEAFHEPVYPRQSAIPTASSGWTWPANSDDTSGGNQA